MRRGHSKGPVLRGLGRLLNSDSLSGDGSRTLVNKKLWAMSCLVVVLMGGIAGLVDNSIIAPHREYPNANCPSSWIACAYAQPSPRAEMTWIGYATNPSTGAVITSSVTGQFSFYSYTGAAPAACPNTGGTLEYNETDTVTPNNQGLYSVLFGSGSVGSPAGNDSTWAGMNWSSTVCLGIRYGTSGAAETGRATLTAAPYLLGKVAWGTQLTAFPAACSAGQAVTSNGATNACAAFLTALLSTSTSLSCAAGSFMNSASESATVSTVLAGFGCSATVASTILSTSNSCGAGSFINSVSATVTTVLATCSAAPSTIGSTSCGSQSFVTSASATTVNCGQDVTFVGATTTQIMSTSTFTTIAALAFTMAAATPYYIQAYIPYACSAAEAFNLGVTIPATATLHLSFAQQLSATAYNNYVQTATSVSDSTATCGTAPNFGIFVTGYVSSTAGGTFQFIFDSGTTATTATVLAGAWMQAVNLAG